MADFKRDPSVVVPGAARTYRVSPLMQLAASLPSVDHALEAFIARVSHSDAASVPAALDAYDAPDATFVEQHARTEEVVRPLHGTDALHMLAELRARLEAAERRAYAAEERSHALAQALIQRASGESPRDSRPALRASGDRRDDDAPRMRAAVAVPRAPSAIGTADAATPDSPAASEALRRAPIGAAIASRPHAARQSRAIAVACAFLAGIAATFAMSRLMWNTAGARSARLPERAPSASQPAGAAAPGDPALPSPRPMVTPILPPIVTPIESPSAAPAVASEPAALHQTPGPAVSTPTTVVPTTASAPSGSPAASGPFAAPPALVSGETKTGPVTVPPGPAAVVPRAASDSEAPASRPVASEPASTIAPRAIAKEPAPTASSRAGDPAAAPNDDDDAARAAPDRSRSPPGEVANPGLEPAKPKEPAAPHGGQTPGTHTGS